ncbi:peptide methionine sulfoxide reductase family protein [Wolffia australiana]
MELKRMEQRILVAIVALAVLAAEEGLAIRIPDRGAQVASSDRRRRLEVAVFALGSFWRSEAVFGCRPGVVKTTVGYAGGDKVNPEFRNLGNHAESVKIEYDPKIILFKQLLEVFWSSHDSRQVFGQGPDVGDQYRSIIFTNGTLEARLAAESKEREQTRSTSSLVTTQIHQLGAFYPAESDHQKFELKRNGFLLQLIGNPPEEEFIESTLASKLNSFSAKLCPPKIQAQIQNKIDEILRKGWPLLREI